MDVFARRLREEINAAIADRASVAKDLEVEVRATTETLKKYLKTFGETEEYRVMVDDMVEKGRTRLASIEQRYNARIIELIAITTKIVTGLRFGIPAA